MEASTMAIDYPATLIVHVDYGVQGRWLGPYKDMMVHYHQIEKFTDPRELMQDMQKPFMFQSFRNVTKTFAYWLIVLGIISVIYLFYLLLVAQDIEEGLQNQDIYFLILLIASIVMGILILIVQKKFNKEILAHVAQLSKAYMRRGVELRAKTKFFSTRGGTQLIITRFKEATAQNGEQTPQQRSFSTNQ